ncbi:hypothetical protein [Streptomyces hygroscopicus]|uniref:hypothetical protein n=1 Tax=Streptomyces hygroscopicus TaxID=1912 RepID=UPI0033E6A02A
MPWYAHVRGTQAAAGVRGHDGVERVQGIGVPVAVDGGQVQGVRHRGSAEEQVGLVTVHQRADGGELAVHGLP